MELIIIAAVLIVLCGPLLVILPVVGVALLLDFIVWSFEKITGREQTVFWG